jgi:hypothetical protein
MLKHLWIIWVPRVLFRLTIFAAAVLVLAILISPVLDAGSPNPQHWRRVVAVCARDLTFRRIALASAAALTVTAYVFFRPSEDYRSMVPDRKGSPSSDSDAEF